ncbi:hypothetical protein F2Q69_00035347 [Brassica cretica]|uniref:Arabidopsis retrotransposon Orf1 C-terminal domain-containing protein n=1 Tax=Brassica cretica TaxID=69181 RepID=A0A8S9SJB3_BRACR|nr:hypothetical protein F2Q69_00035347 [Brassica cretica]
MADGKFCSLSLDKLNEIYEIEDERRKVAVENKFAPSNPFWDLIANGTFTSRKAYQSQIRNPTLRVIAKMISNLQFAKDQTSKVTKGEQQMLYSGVEDEIRRARAGIPIQSVQTNHGYFRINLHLYMVNHNIDTLKKIRFLPDPEFLCADTRAPPPDADMDDVEDITPDDTVAYDLGPQDEDADDATYRQLRSTG